MGLGLVLVLTFKILGLVLVLVGVGVAVILGLSDKCISVWCQLVRVMVLTISGLGFCPD